jgi:mannosyltransferase OCH1-like enzyme
MSLLTRFGRVGFVLIVVALGGLFSSGVFLGSSTLSTQTWTHTSDSSPDASAASAIDDDTNFPFPKKIWQTGKSIQVSKEMWPLVLSWQQKNPTFRYELLNDYGAEDYVREHFADQPKLMNAYLDTPDIILRADMLRIMVMWASGGVYSDIDTECLVPIAEWVPKEYYGRASLVVGFETERSRDEDADEEARKQVQVCQWTLMAIARSKHVLGIIDHIVDNMHQLAEQRGVPFGELGANLKVPEVIWTTGPAEVTVALLRSLSDSLGEPVDRSNVSGHLGPFLLDDVLFLPVNAFAGHQRHSHSGHPELGPLLVRHYYGSSWWEAHGGR